MGMPDGNVIIEFDGVAGCGKSTLCMNIKKMLQKEECTVIYINERPFESYFTGFKKYQLYRYIQTFSLRSLFNCVKLMVGLRAYKELKKIFQLYEILSIYNWFIKKHKERAILVCDQSIIQTIVSLWGYEKIKTLSLREINAISSFLKTCPRAVNYFCDLPLDENLFRIRKRARNHGRLNLISDDAKLFQMLSNNYVNLKNVIFIQSKLDIVYHLNMLLEEEELAIQVINTLSLQKIMRGILS